MPTYYRIVNQFELNSIVSSGKVPPSLENWPPYPAGTVAFVFSQRSSKLELQYTEDKASHGMNYGALHPYHGDFFLISWDDPDPSRYFPDQSATPNWSALVVHAPLPIRQLNGKVVEQYVMSSAPSPRIVRILSMNQSI